MTAVAFLMLLALFQTARGAGPSFEGAVAELIFEDSFETDAPPQNVMEDWPKYRRDLANTGRSAESGISSANLARLATRWSVAPGCPSAPCPRISASPAIATVGGIRTLYVGNWNGQFFARNAEDGSERWTFEIPDTHRGEQSCPIGDRCRIASSPAVADGLVYFGAENARLYALDAATGNEVWSVSVGDPDQGYEIWSSPVVYAGVVYVGVASHSAVPCVAGQLVARDAADGSEVWTFDAIDQSTCESGQGDCLGAGIWSSPAIDTATNTLYVGTGNAGEGCSPSTPHADLYPNGIVALDLSDGSVKDFFQTLARDPNDAGDIGASPLLHDTRVADQCTLTNVTRRWVSVPSKDGFYYTAERDVTGFVGDFMGLELVFNPNPAIDPGEQAIASPTLLPVKETTECAADKQVTTEGSDLFVPRRDGYLFSLRQDGQGAVSTRFNVQVTGCGPSNGCVMVSGPSSIQDVVIVGGGEGNIYGLSQDGVELWSSGANGLIAASPAISHGVVYYAAYDGVIYAKSIDGQ